MSLTIEAQQQALFWTIGLVEPFAIVTCMWGRMSFAMFLLYIIGTADNRQKMVLWTVIAVQAVINAVTIIQIFAQCGAHVEALWNYAAAGDAVCQSRMVQTIIGFVQSGLNSACDLVLTISPLLVLWKLNMPMSQKIGLGAILTLSIFAFAASLVKCVQIRNLSETTDFSCMLQCTADRKRGGQLTK
jgi:hypothetical protein